MEVLPKGFSRSKTFIIRPNSLLSNLPRHFSFYTRIDQKFSFSNPFCEVIFSNDLKQSPEEWLAFYFIISNGITLGWLLSHYYTYSFKHRWLGEVLWFFSHFFINWSYTNIFRLRKILRNLNFPSSHHKKGKLLLVKRWRT